MRLDMVEALTTAIRERRPVRLEYRYRGQGLRTVHPHALYSTPRGLMCDVYQVAGYTSERRTLPGWRAMDVGQVVNVEMEPGRFSLAPGYNPAAERYRNGVVAPRA
jgi:hypothetical protein